MSEAFQPVPRGKIESGWKGHVHVEGWNPACVFILTGIDALGAYKLVTPKTGRRYRTMNRLLYTRGNTPLSLAATTSATKSPRSQPGATTGPRKRRAGAQKAVPAGSGLEIDGCVGPDTLTSNIPRPEQTVDHPCSGMTKAAQH